jgi:hypothetical protein
MKLPAPKSAANTGKPSTEKNDTFDTSFDDKNFFANDFNAGGPAQYF